MSEGSPQLLADARNRAAQLLSTLERHFDEIQTPKPSPTSQDELVTGREALNNAIIAVQGVLASIDNALQTRS